MGRVRLLSDILAHKIAAGEIVDRPASVVKELIENSLDAEAKKIVIKVEDGGRHRISVEDDGFGMSPIDAQTAFSHHATSKISSFEDLTHITTLGFRGEALPSIAAVSRLRLCTVEQQGTDHLIKPGHEIYFEGGKLLREQETAWPLGTLVDVRDLFFNVPARRKFLKTIATEIRHISKEVTKQSLANPQVEFQLHHQARVLVQAPAVESLEDRVCQVLGNQFLENLVKVEHQSDGIEVTGYTSLPYEQRSTSRAQYLFVNGRAVRDRTLTHALRLAYRDRIPTAAHPVTLLFINLDPTEIDVNVHPNKTEIRFRHSRQVHRAIHHALEHSLLQPENPDSNLGRLARDIKFDGIIPGSSRGHQISPKNSDLFFHRHPDSSLGFRELRQYSEVSKSPKTAGPENNVNRGDPHRFNIPETAYLSPVPVVLGQFVESFIVAADREGVMLVDQHVAHERILYDQALRCISEGKTTPTQRLLIPETMELTPDQTASMQILIQHFTANGFEVEWFGKRTIVIKGVPSVAAGSGKVRPIIEDVLAGLDLDTTQGPSGEEIKRLQERIAISMSCQSAIKINTPLSPDKMRWFIDALFRCDNPYTCPHGRPIVLRMGIEDVLRGFKRI
jgi:DNA mismatch repair protein MutL